jgi:hypothetical protein
LFKKHSTVPSESDLWIINEDFIYFTGNSDLPLTSVEIGGERFLKDSFTEEEERYLASLGEDRKLKRPDVLLFPDEGKCIILEFKKPDVNVSDHMTQITKYASLILNFSHERFGFSTFYGYLIGEAIESRDVRAADADFVEAYNWDYLFRPSKNVFGEDGRNDGSLYTEVIKYSTLLKRAQRRNKIFIDKLTANMSEEDTGEENE